MSMLSKGICLLLSAMLTAQQEPEAVRRRVHEGGVLIAAEYRRGDDGLLEILTGAYTGDPERLEHRPLLAPFGEVNAALQSHNLGGVGLLAMVCHGDGDLLAMTDAGFHFGALGIDASDIGLRQYLAQPLPSFEGRRGRAELLDRLLAIDRLQRHGVRGAVAELTRLATDAALPAALRERAAQALAVLRGEPAAPRARLAVEQLRLPAAFDGCLVIDHARLPDLRWLTAFGRRLGMAVTAEAVVMAGGTASDTMWQGAQGMADGCSVGPFWFAHALGNLRLDHSCLVVTAKADPHVPVAVTWQAVGAFDHAGWSALDLSPLTEELRLDAAAGSITASALWLSSDGSQGRARPQQAEKLLADTGAALRAFVPGNSKLWPLLAFLQLPPASGADLRVTFGEPATIELRVEARDEDAAADWVAKGREGLVGLQAAFAANQLESQAELALLMKALAAAEFRVEERSAIGVVRIAGFTAAHRDRLLGYLLTLATAF